MEPIEVIELDNGNTVFIYPDDDPGSPRDWDNLGTIVAWHNRYDLGDEQPGGNPEDWMREFACSLDDTLENRLYYWEDGNGYTSIKNKADKQAAAKVREAMEAADRAEEDHAHWNQLVYALELEYDANHNDDIREQLNAAIPEYFRSERTARDAREHAITMHQQSWRVAWKIAEPQIDKRVQDAIAAAIEKHCIILPVHAYEHGGITLNTSSYSCSWDSGQVGYIYVTIADVRKEYGVKRVTRRIRELAERVLRQEIATYAQYLEGDVYGYIVEDEDGEHVDSCWGYYGHEYCKQEAIAAAQ